MRPIAELATLAVPGPTVTAETRPFWDGAAQGHMVLQRCAACNSWTFYPRKICPHCWSDQLEWRPASGEATLKTWSIVERPAHPAWEPIAPYTIGLVELVEGPTMLTHLLAEPTALFLGLRLRVRFARIGAHILPCFEPA